MDREYDIFEQLPNGSVEWHDVVIGFEAARARLDRLGRRSQHEFYAKDMSANQVVARVNAHEDAHSQKATRPVMATVWIGPTGAYLSNDERIIAEIHALIDEQFAALENLLNPHEAAEYVRRKERIQELLQLQKKRTS